MVNQIRGVEVVVDIIKVALHFKDIRCRKVHRDGCTFRQIDTVTRVVEAPTQKMRVSEKRLRKLNTSSRIWGIVLSVFFCLNKKSPYVKKNPSKNPQNLGPWIKSKSPFEIWHPRPGGLFGCQEVVPTFHQGRVYLRYLQKDPGIHFISSKKHHISSRKVSKSQIRDLLKTHPFRSRKRRPPATPPVAKLASLIWKKVFLRSKK